MSKKSNAADQTIAVSVTTDEKRLIHSVAHYLSAPAAGLARDGMDAVVLAFGSTLETFGIDPTAPTEEYEENRRKATYALNSVAGGDIRSENPTDALAGVVKAAIAGWFRDNSNALRSKYAECPAHVEEAPKPAVEVSNGMLAIPGFSKAITPPTLPAKGKAAKAEEPAQPPVFTPVGSPPAPAVAPAAAVGTGKAAKA